jgi:hypothetical protein
VKVKLAGIDVVCLVYGIAGSVLAVRKPLSHLTTPIYGQKMGN